MVMIKNDADIAYTHGDTFEIAISGEPDFSDGSILRIQIAKSDGESAVVERKYNLVGNEFNVVLNDDDKAKLPIGNYVYRFTVLDLNNKIVTMKSGNFFVQWGCC